MAKACGVVVNTGNKYELLLVYQITLCDSLDSLTVDASGMTTVPGENIKHKVDMKNT